MGDTEQLEHWWQISIQKDNTTQEGYFSTKHQRATIPNIQSFKREMNMVGGVVINLTYIGKMTRRELEHGDQS